MHSCGHETGVRHFPVALLPAILDARVTSVRLILMSKGHMAYFEKDDVLHFAISDEPKAGSVEVSPDITAELNAKGELIGIEILNASRFLRDTVLDSVQARMLELAEAKVP